jgi:hypothetical protein
MLGEYYSRRLSYPPNIQLLFDIREPYTISPGFRAGYLCASTSIPYAAYFVHRYPDVSNMAPVGVLGYCFE